jgi:HNH endonuclease
MNVEIINADVFEALARLPDESVHCVVTRATDGRFAKGKSYSPSTQFKKGTHWRQPKPHWSRDWLYREYVQNGRSSSEIAAEVGCKENNIHFWLHKHGIPRRTVAQAREIKHWGVAGSANPMFGKTGAKNPRYVDGSSPERQRLYVQAQGRDFLRRVYARDNFRCQRCDSPSKGPRTLHAHHIKSWASNQFLRFDINNAVTLCRPCHSWVHSKKNAAKEWLA